MCIINTLVTTLAYFLNVSESLKFITREMTSGEQVCIGMRPFFFCIIMLASSWTRKQATVAVAWEPTSPECPKLSQTCMYV